LLLPDRRGGDESFPVRQTELKCCGDDDLDWQLG
jgi:hypothetical protein